MYIYCSTSIDIKIKFEIPFHPNPRRITFPQSRNPLTSPPKKYEKTISNLLKNTTQKNIRQRYLSKKKREEKYKRTPSIHEATFRQQEEKENTPYHGRSARRIACNQSRFKRNPVEDGNPADSLGGRFSFPNSIGARMLDTREFRRSIDPIRFCTPARDRLFVDACFLDSTVSLRFRGFNVRACWVVIDRSFVGNRWRDRDKLVFFPRSL